LGSFNPFPVLPFEATTFEQDALVVMAKQLVGDGVEQEPIDACQKLIDDPTSPFELKRWATLRQVQLFTYCKQESVALEIAARWLTQYGRVDPNPLAIRSVCAKIVGQRGHELFRPGFEDKRLVYEDLFRHHSGNEWDVIEAHMDFAMHLEYRYAETRDTQVLEERVGHLMLAESKIREQIADAEQARDNARKQQFEKILGERVTPQLDRASQVLERRIAADRLRPVQAQGAAQTSQDHSGSLSSPPRP
jgi:hypothetical protein